MARTGVATGRSSCRPKKSAARRARNAVVQGERLPTIARKEGFRRWQTVWDFGGNAGLKDQRGDAHILFPGDQVAIPSKLSRVAEVPSGKAEYVVLSAPEVLRTRFADVAAMDGEPVLFRATPDAGSEAFEGELAEDGTMEIELPPDTTKVVVELFCGDGDQPFVTHELAMGELDPADEATGIQARLANLGYYRGKIDGDVGEVTHAAIARFRREYGLSPSNAVDDDLVQALEWLHDDGDDTDDCEADQTVTDQEGGAADVDESATADANAGEGAQGEQSEDHDGDDHGDDAEEEEGDDDAWLAAYLGHGDDEGDDRDDEGDADQEEVTT